MDPASDAAMAKMRRRMHVTSVSYWRGLVPDCTIEDDPFRVLPLLHWGARSSAMAKGPRMSFAFYFQSRHVPPYHAVTMDIPSPIPFDYRLYLLEKMRRGAEGEDPSFRHLQQPTQGT